MWRGSAQSWQCLGKVSRCLWLCLHGEQGRAQRGGWGEEWLCTAPSLHTLLAAPRPLLLQGSGRREAVRQVGCCFGQWLCCLCGSLRNLGSVALLLSAGLEVGFGGEVSLQCGSKLHYPLLVLMGG